MSDKRDGGCKLKTEVAMYQGAQRHLMEFSNKGELPKIDDDS